MLSFNHAHARLQLSPQEEELAERSKKRKSIVHFQKLK